MDFHSLSRRELQSLCKLNKIPANITNVAMADALQSLDTVVGIEEFLNGSQSETADLVESVEPVEAPSPKAPQTRCRTSTRQKAKPAETETLQTTVTRTTRRGSKQVPKEVEESKNDLLKTPAVPRTTRKGPATTARRNVNNQLNECEDEPKEEGLVENRYSTRRSTRLTEKKSVAPSAKKAVEKAVKIDSFLDQGNSNAEVEGICNAFEKLDVVVIEEEATHDESVEEDGDSGEVSNLEVNTVSCEHGELENNVKISQVNDVKTESDGASSPSEENTHKSGEKDEDYDEVNNLEDDLNNSEVKNDEVYDLKPISDDISSQCEDDNVVQKVDSADNIMTAMEEQNPVMVEEEHSVADDISNPCEVESFEVKENNFAMVQEETSDSLLESGVDAEMEHEDTPCVDSEMVIENAIDEITTKEVEEMTEITAVDEKVEAIPTMDDDDSTMSDEVQDAKSVLLTENSLTEKSDAASGLAQNPLILSDAAEDPTQAAPFKNTLSIITDDKENNVDEGKNRKKEKDEDEKKNYYELSMRQLKKQLKELTLKSHNTKEEAAAGTTRPALQALCENQMVVGGETEN